MKTLFIEAKYKSGVEISPLILARLPNKVGLVSTIQFLDHLKEIKEDFERNDKKAIIGGQILGCNVKNAEKIANKVDAFLYVGDGEFHPLAIALKINKPVYQYNPLNKEFRKIKDEEIAQYKKNQKISYIRFLHADNVGIIISTKPGQHYPIKRAEQLKKKYKNKKFYTFICDNVDEREFENFNFIQAWVNTACSRITGKNMINVEEVK